MCRQAVPCWSALGRNAVPGRNVPVAAIPVIQVHTIQPDTETVQTVAQIGIPRTLPLDSGQNWDSRPDLRTLREATGAALRSPRHVRVAAKMANGLPLLVDRKVGEGHVLIFASAFDNIDNNLPLQPVWLPLPWSRPLTRSGGVGSTSRKRQLQSRFLTWNCVLSKRRISRSRSSVRTTSGC